APLVVPIILLAMGNFDVQTQVGLVETDAGLILLHTTITYPLALIIISNALNKQDPSLEEAAWSMGMSKVKTFWTVTVPGLRPSIAAAAVLSFVTSWDEAVLSTFQTGLQGTLPVTIFSLLRSGVTPAVPAVAVLLML